MTRRLGGLVLGWTLVVLGVAALVLPGPGLLLLAGGLVVLSQEYEWAERRVEPVRAKAFELAQAGVRDWRSVALSLVLALGLIALGVIWGLGPPAPDWWPLEERWWLPGGWGTGSSLIGSGLIALGLLVYSYRRFRGDAAR
ncbi:PGPGW domain-containing protein [Xylanimonas sp. McL0601]|uniref:PGPGW domain-containing protein n=1 Tax=Xylanimonas sp. McL0601 TaxID=3414739 RepID=UPI003CFA0E33